MRICIFDSVFRDIFLEERRLREKNVELHMFTFLTIWAFMQSIWSTHLLCDFGYNVYLLTISNFSASEQSVLIGM